MPKIGHEVIRPGLMPSDEAITIPIAEDLESVPGIPTNQKDVDFYSREYPLENHRVINTADIAWEKTVTGPAVTEYKRQHEPNITAMVQAELVSGDIPPVNEPKSYGNVTEEIRAEARRLGFGEVGFTKFDRRYVYEDRKEWVKFTHAICLAMEQDYESTQTTPSLAAEYAHFGTYETAQEAAAILADYIRDLGYHAQINGPLHNSVAYIPLFVEAGLGQLGANGQLLSPHFGSRARLLIIGTDAPIIYDSPVDYGIHRFCQKCQICVNRCPGRAITREKVWYRGVEKNKLIYKRCRPIMSRYEGCAVCIKVCPIQRYGMKPVMEHYVKTRQILGKATHGLEGYSLPQMGYFGPGELPHFDTKVFQIPRGRSEDWEFEKFKESLASNEIPDGPEGDRILLKFKARVKKHLMQQPSKAGLG